jgi:hypothetical protein
MPVGETELRGKTKYCDYIASSPFEIIHSTVERMIDIGMNYWHLLWCAHIQVLRWRCHEVGGASQKEMIAIDKKFCKRGERVNIEFLSP